MNDNPQEFDVFSDEYRTIHNKNLRMSGAESEYFCEHKILEIKKEEKAESVSMLDFGCGDGMVSKYFFRHFPSGSYTGIDISSENIRQAQSRKSDHCSFHHYPGDRIPFQDETFDFALVANVFHHIDRKDHVATIMEIARTLKPGGRIYIFEHNPTNPMIQWIVKTCAFDRNARLLLPYRFRKYFKNAGMISSGPKYVLFFPRHKIFRFLFPLEETLKWLPLGGQYIMTGKKPFPDPS